MNQRLTVLVLLVLIGAVLSKESTRTISTSSRKISVNKNVPNSNNLNPDIAKAFDQYFNALENVVALGPGEQMKVPYKTYLQDYDWCDWDEQNGQIDDCSRKDGIYGEDFLINLGLNYGWDTPQEVLEGVCQKYIHQISRNGIDRHLV